MFCFDSFIVLLAVLAKKQRRERFHKGLLKLLGAEIYAEYYPNDDDLGRETLGNSPQQNNRSNLVLEAGTVSAGKSNLQS